MTPSAQITSAGRTRPRSRYGTNASVRTSADYEIVDRETDIKSALRLVYQAYLQQGYIERNQAQMRLIPQHLLPTTEILVARLEGEIVFTATLVFDTPEAGLPLQSLYPAEVVALRKQGHLVEISCLAHDPEKRPSLSVVVRSLALIGQCSRCRGADMILAVVHPHHLDFYTGFFGFRALGQMKHYSAVGDQPAVAIALDLKNLEQQHPQGFKRIFGTSFPEETLRRRPVSAAVRDRLRALMEVPGASRSPRGLSRDARVVCH